MALTPDAAFWEGFGAGFVVGGGGVLVVLGTAVRYVLRTASRMQAATALASATPAPPPIQRAQPVEPRLDSGLDALEHAIRPSMPWPRV